MTQYTEISNCPYCGNVGYLGKWPAGYAIVCDANKNECIADPYTKFFKVKKESVTAWNNREFKRIYNK